MTNEDRIAELERRIEEHEQRIEELEQSGETTPEIGEEEWMDRHDREALAVIDADAEYGTVVKLSTIQSAYRTTGIKQSSTMRNRVETLIKSGPFKENRQQGNTWTYVPDTVNEVEPEP